MKPTASLRHFLCIASSVLLAAPLTHAASGTWLGTSGDWGTAGTWSGGTLAEGTGFTANFTGVDISADQIINLEAARTIGNITFTDTTTSSNNLTISGANILTLDVASGASLIDVTQADRTLTISSQIAGADGLQKNGLGTLILSGNNNYTGITTVSAGTLKVGHANAIGAAGDNNHTIVGSGATLDLNGFSIGEQFGKSSATQTDGFVDITSILTNSSATAATVTGGILFNAGGEFTVNGSNGGITLNTVSNSTGAGTITLTKSGANTLTLAGTVDNSYMAMSVSAGTVILGKTSSASVHAVGSGLTLNNAAIAQLGGSGGDQIFNNADVTLNGTSALDMNGKNETINGLTGVSGTTIYNTANATASTLTVGNANGTSAFGGVIANNAGGGQTGTLAVTKIGSGVLTLSGNNSYSGVTAISAGILAISHSNALGNNTGNTTITATGASGGPQLQLSGNINSPENITLNGSSDANQYNGVILNTSGTNTLSGNITLASPTSSIRITSNGGELILGGTISQTGTTRNLRLQTLPGAFITVNNAIANNGGQLDILGSASGAATGIITLKGASTGIGATSINENGTLKLGINDAIKTTSNLTLGVVSTAAGFDFATFDLAGFNQTVAGLIGTKNTSNIGADDKRVVTNSAASGTSLLTVGNGNATSIFNGVILNGATAAVALTKIGTGTQTLAGVNTYTGTTTIKAGTLALGASGTFANSATVVVGDAGSSGAVLDLTSKASFAFGSGQTVKGIGTINIGAGKTITINGALAKGNSIGTQAYLGNLTLAGNDQIELGNSTGAGTYASPYNSDLGNVSGNLTLGGTLSVIDNAGADSNGSISAGSYKIYTYLGTTSGSYSSITNATGYRADIVNNGAGTGSGQGIYLDNYRVAAAASTQTVTLNTRTGVAVSTSLSLTNTNNVTAPFQENLGTTGFSGTSSGYTATGSATGIADGGTGSGTLSVGVDAGTVATAGTYSGSTTLGLQTEEVNSSGLGNAGVGNQAVTINITAYDFATAAFSKTAGDGSLTGSGLSYTLDFGTGLALNTNYTATLQLANGMFSLYKDSLQGAYGTVGGAFSETAGNFASLTSGGTDTFTISFFTGSTGTFTDTLTFDGTSLNSPLGNSALSQINIGISATAIPEPRAALLGGLGLLVLLRRRRN